MRHRRCRCTIIGRMSPELYRLLHVTGALMLFLGLGGMLASEPGKGSKIYGMLHGIGWLVMLVCGIGFAHKTQLGWPNWMIAKIGILVLLGALPFLTKRGVLPRPLAALLVIGLGAAAYYLVQSRPF